MTTGGAIGQQIKMQIHPVYVQLTLSCESAPNVVQLGQIRRTATERDIFMNGRNILQQQNVSQM